MMVSYDWLAGHADKPGIKVIDTRPKVAYGYGHLKGALNLGIEDLIKTDRYGSNLAAEPDMIARTLGRLGINNDDTLIVAGDPMDPSPARVLWTLQYMGHKKISFLKEGISSLQGKAELTRKRNESESSTFVPDVNPHLRINADELAGSLNNITILDARTPQEYMHGHIPGAVLAPFTDGLGRGDLFLPEDELSRIHARHDKGADIVCYCMHGHRAASLMYQLRLAGFEKVRLYDGSFVEWYGRGFTLE